MVATTRRHRYTLNTPFPVKAGFFYSEATMISSRDLNDLHPAVKRSALAMISACDAENTGRNSGDMGVDLLPVSVYDRNCCAAQSGEGADGSFGGGGMIQVWVWGVSE
jgi:hypothetical protein